MTTTRDADAGPALSLSGVRREYARRREEPRVALRGLDLVAPRGAWLALLGPNGSGKSTLLRILATADAPTAGSVRVLGFDLHAQAREIRRRIGVVFQSPALDPLLTVRENLRTHAALFSVERGASLRARIENAARAVRVEDRLDDRVGTLSGGLARRADLARAMLSAPEMLLLDEPSSGLDPAARAELLDLLTALRAERPGLTIVMSTHQMDEAERAERVLMLASGEIVADGDPLALRRGLGGASMSVHASEGDTLRAHGLETRPADEGRRLLAFGDAASVAAAAAELASRGVEFSFGPPTLDDVYLARTGRSVSEMRS